MVQVGVRLVMEDMVVGKDTLLKIIGQLTVEKAMLQDAVTMLVAERDALREQLQKVSEQKLFLDAQQVGQEDTDAGHS